MATEKTLNRLKKEMGKKITPKKFFTSPHLTSYFEGIIRVINRRRGGKGKRPVAVKVNINYSGKTGEDDHIAFTTGKTIVVNADHPFVLGGAKDLEEHLSLVKGLVAHELGHVLFTNFDAIANWQYCMKMGRWWPCEPKKIRIAEEISDYVNEDKKKLEYFLSIVNYIYNCLEDGYIEEKYMNKYPGNLTQSLYDLRDYQFNSSIEVENLQYKTDLSPESMEHIYAYSAYVSLILCYAKYGEFKVTSDDAYSLPLIKKMSKLMPFIDNYVNGSSSEERYTALNNIIVELWPEIKEYMENVPFNPESNSEIDDTISSMASSSSSEGDGEGEDGEDGSDETSSSKSERSKKSSKTKKKSSSKKSDESSDGDSEDGDSSEKSSSKSKKSKKSSKEKSEDGSEEEKGSGKDKSDSSDESEENSSGRDGATDNDDKSDDSEKGTSEIQDVSPESDGEHSGTEESKCEESTGSGESVDEDYSGGGYDSAADDIERLLDAMAEDAALEKMESDRLAELNRDAETIDGSYGSAHDSVTYYIERLTEVPEKLIEQYNKIAAPLLQISKQAQKKFKQKIKDQQVGGKMTGLYYGKRINMPAIIKNDGRLFYKNKLPTDKAQLSVCILVDESGSMWSSDRATTARATAIILEDFCRGLDIPCAIYGHSSDQSGHGGTDVEIYAYSDFDKIDSKDKYRLMDINARANNRDGAALRYCGHKLKKRTEPKKLLIVISDGQPCSSGYSGRSAEADMTSIVKKLRKEGCTVIAAAIGEDKDNIHRIYGDGFLDISNLKMLPTILINVISRNLKF